MEEETQDFKHNWLYSVVPVFTTDIVLLAGYCKYCNKAFSKQIPWDSNPEYVMLTDMDIPKWGCVDPSTLL